MDIIGYTMNERIPKTDCLCPASLYTNMVSSFLKSNRSIHELTAERISCIAGTKTYKTLFSANVHCDTLHAQKNLYKQAIAAS